MTEIKTALEIWDEVPEEDVEDLANQKKWVSSEEYFALLKKYHDLQFRFRRAK